MLRVVNGFMQIHADLMGANDGDIVIREHQ